LNTNVYEYPVHSQLYPNQKTADEVSLWEQANLLVMVQREWADNAVSNTLLFKPRWRLTKEFNVTCPECNFIMDADYLTVGQMKEHTCPKCNSLIRPTMIINQKLTELGLTSEIREVRQGDYKIIIERKSGT